MHIFFMYINFFSFDNKFINFVKGVCRMKKITVAILIFLFGLFLFVDKKNHREKNNFIETEATEFDGYEKISEFATEFNTKSFGRAENIKLSAKKINGKEIKFEVSHSLNFRSSGVQELQEFRQ